MSALGRVLVVDDEPEVVSVLCEFLSACGYTVASATSGAAALAEVGRTRPDLILVDINMPGIDGVEVLQRLHTQHPEIRVVMLTANEDVEVARRTLQMGAFDYVAKPFDFSHIERVVLAGVTRPARPGVTRPAEPADAAAAPAIHALAVSVFRAVRSMGDVARVSIGERLEASALAALRHAAAGEPREALRMLDDLALLVRLAGDLGDVSPVERSALEAALAAARTSGGARE